MKTKFEKRSLLVALLALVFGAGASTALVTKLNGQTNTNLVGPKMKCAREFSVDKLFGKPTSAMYFQNVGVRAEGATPIFISSGSPSQIKLKEMFVANVKNVAQIRQFIVSKADLDLMIENVNRILVPKSRDWWNPKAETFDFGVIGDGAIKVRTMAISQFVPALWIIQKQSAEKYKDLYLSISELRRKAGYPASEKEPLSRNQALRIATDDMAKDGFSENDLGRFDLKVSLLNKTWHVDWLSKHKGVEGGQMHYVVNLYSGQIEGKRCMQ